MVWDNDKDTHQQTLQTLHLQNNAPKDELFY